MSVGGVLPGAFFRSDPARLALLGVRWVQVPVDLLGDDPGTMGRGEPLDITLEPGESRLFPLPMIAATRIVLVSSLSDAVSVPQDETVVLVRARLASTGREFVLEVKAGVHTAEWAIDRPDVRAHAAHGRAPIAQTWPGPGGGFLAHLYEGTLSLPGRYYLDGLSVERLPGRGPLRLAHLAVIDDVAHRTTAVALGAAYASDTRHLVERSATPAVRLFELPAAAPARVVERLRVLPGDAAVVDALAMPTRLGIDPAREALVTADDAARVRVPAGSRAGRAEMVIADGGRIDVRGAGPGVVVVAAAWDRGWEATVDGAPVPIARVNHAEMAVPIEAGIHRVVFRHHARGLLAGVALAALAAAGIGLAVARGRVDPSPKRVLA
jgi:hypothetical protein